MPAAGEYEARARTRVVEYRLGRSRSVVIDSPGDEDGQDALTASHGPPDYVPVVRCPGNDGYSVLEPVEFFYASLPAYADNLIAPVKGMPDHVPAELPGRTDDADFPYFHIPAPLPHQPGYRPRHMALTLSRDR